MTTNLQASVEYLRDYKPIYDGVSYDFLKHITNVARVCLAENDPTPLTIEDVERMLGKECDDDMDTVDVGNVSFEASADVIEMWRFNDSSADHVATLTTHGEFRTFCRLFKVEVKA